MWHDLIQYAVLCGVGVIAAALNAVAGGGSFFTFPILVFLGLNPSIANSTNKFAIWLGAASSAVGYRRMIRAQAMRIWPVCLVTMIGSFAGSLLLLMTPAEQFRAMVPWLMLGATVLFAFGGRLVDWLRDRVPESGMRTQAGRMINWALQFLIGLYGGFFGAGIGILLMAFCQLIGVRDIHQSNALKVVVSTSLLSLSAVTFISAGAINWQYGLPLAAGMLVGGFAGAHISTRIPQRLIRGFIILYGLFVSGYFFWM